VLSISLFSNSPKPMSKTAEDWKADGNAAVKKGDHAAAYEAYSEGLKVEPDHAMILSNRALSLQKLGRLEEALVDAKRCAELRPDFLKGFLRAAMSLRELGRPQEALEFLKKSPKNEEIEQLASKLRPEAEAAEKKRIAALSGAERQKEEGNALFKKGSFEQALEVYQKALKACADPKGEMAIAIRNNMAGCYQQLSDFQSVVAQTNFVLEHQPDNVKALLRRMLALEPLEKYEQALADARLVLRHAPGNEAANKMQHRLSKVVRDRVRTDGSMCGA
jgi:tetratricopeptide (TPR) repeat protein